MNSMIVAIDEECGEVKITTGIQVRGNTVQRVYGAACGVMAGYMAGAAYGVEFDRDDIQINIEEGAKFVVTVGADADGRLVVCLYNSHNAPANAVLSLMAELTEFEA